MSIQRQLAEKVQENFPTALVKKVDKDNHVDINLPDIHEKKGTHLFFNTAKSKIKLGFYCRDEEFVQNALAKSDLLEGYSQGIRLKDNPVFDSVEEAVNAAINLISAISGQGVETKKIADETPVSSLEEPEVDEEIEQDDERGYPMMRFRIPESLTKDIAMQYLAKWQKPSDVYGGRLGIGALIPDWVEELITDDVCPVFSHEQLSKIASKIGSEKIIPILGYAPDELFNYTKKVWWIVPFCIWKEEIASFVFVDKDGFYALLYDADEQETDLQLIFPWEGVHEIEFEQAYDDDPNVNRLTLYQENGGYLTFDEFVSEGKDGDMGSYLSVIIAIWEIRRETIEVSRGEPTWYEGAGGEGFKAFENPSDLLNGKEWLDAFRPEPNEFGYQKTSPFDIVKVCFENEDWDEVVRLGTNFVNDNEADKVQLGQAQYYLGCAYFNKEEFENAINHLRSSIEINPESKKYAELAKALKANGQHSEVIHTCLAAFELSDADIMIIRDTARFYIDFDKDFKGAIDVLTEGIEKNVKSKVEIDYFDLLYAERGNIYLYLKNYNAAVKDFLEAIHLNAKNHPGWRFNKLGLAYYNAGNYSEAVKYLLASQQEDSDYVNQLTLHALGHSYFELKDYDQAIIAYEKAIALGLNDSFVWYRIGRSYSNLNKDLDKALSYLDKGVQMDPNYKWFFQEKGRIFMKLQRYNEVIENYTKVFEIDPKSSFSLHQIGEANHFLGQYEIAVEYFDRAIAINPNHEWSYHDKAQSLIDLKKYQEALDCLNSFKFSKIWNRVAELKFQLSLYFGDFEQVNEIIEQLREVYPNGTPKNITYLIGKMYHFLSEFKEAEKYYEKIEFSYLLRYLDLHYSNVMVENETVLEREDAFISKGDDKILGKKDTEIVVKSLVRRGQYTYYKESGGFDSEFKLYNYNKALELDPDYFDALHGKARVLLNSKYSVYSKEEGVKLLERCLEIKELPILYVELGEQKEDLNEALKLKLKAVEMNPKLKKGWKSLSKTYFELKEYKKAIEALEQISEHQDDDFLMKDIAISKYHLGLFREVIEILEDVTSRVDHLGEWFFYLSQAYAKDNQIDKAIDAIEKALINSDKPIYYEFMAEIYRNHTADKDKANAYQALSNFIEVTKGEKEEQIKYLEGNSTNSDFNHFSFLSVYRKISDFLVNHIIENGSYPVKTHLAKNPFIKVEYLDKLVEAENFTVLEAAVSNQKLDEKRIEDIVSKDDGSYRYSFALLGALSNPNITQSQIEILINHKYNWVKKKAASSIKKKIDYSEIDDRYILSGLLINVNYSSVEKNEIADKADSAPKKVLLYNLPADYVGIEEYVLGADEDGSLREHVINTILDSDIESWEDYCKDSFYEYGESEYGVNSLVDEVIIKDPDIETELSESFDLNSISTFKTSSPFVTLNLETGSLIHEAVSGEKGSWNYSEFELEWEFRPEFLTPDMGDNGRVIVGYNFSNVSENEEDIYIDGELVESSGFGKDISLYLVTKVGLLDLYFDEIRDQIQTTHNSINYELIDRYLKNLAEETE